MWFFLQNPDRRGSALGDRPKICRYPSVAREAKTAGDGPKLPCPRLYRSQTRARTPRSSGIDEATSLKGGSMSGITDERNSLAMEQYRILRSELMAKIKGREETTRFAVIGSGAAASWLMTNTGNGGVPAIAYWIPAIICIAFFFSWLSSGANITSTGRFCEMLERELKLTDQTGWQLYWRRQRSRRISFLLASDNLVWASIVIASCCFGWHFAPLPIRGLLWQD